MPSSSSPSAGETELTDTAYDILKVLGKDADFIYDTIDIMKLSNILIKL
jgi:hypothetical protein